MSWWQHGELSKVPLSIKIDMEREGRNFSGTPTVWHFRKAVLSILSPSIVAHKELRCLDWGNLSCGLHTQQVQWASSGVALQSREFIIFIRGNFNNSHAVRLRWSAKHYLALTFQKGLAVTVSPHCGWRLWLDKSPISLLAMYSNSLDNFDDSETSPVGFPFFSRSDPNESAGSEDWGYTMKRTGGETRMTKWVLSYQSGAAAKRVRSEQRHNEGGPMLHRVDRGESRRLGGNAGQKVGKFAVWASSLALSLSLPLSLSDSLR